MDKKIYILISEDTTGHVHLDGVMSSQAEAEKAKKRIAKLYHRKVRIEERRMNDTLGFTIGYWHAKRNKDGKVTHTAQFSVQPFTPGL
jgi:xylose isomerase